MTCKRTAKKRSEFQPRSPALPKIFAATLVWWIYLLFGSNTNSTYLHINIVILHLLIQIMVSCRVENHLDPHPALMEGVVVRARALLYLSTRAIASVFKQIRAVIAEYGDMRCRE